MRYLGFTFAVLILFAAARPALAVEGEYTDLEVSAGNALTTGAKLFDKGDYEGAKRYFSAAIHAQPDLWAAYYQRALVLGVQKNYAAELQDLNSTIRLQPAFFQASWDRSLVYLKLGNYAASLRDLNALASVTLQTKNADELGQVLNQRGWLRATCPEASLRNGQLGVADAKRACQLSKWKKSKYIDTLAAASAEAGDFDSAVRYEEQAISLNKSGSDESASQTSKGPADKAADESARKRLQGYSQRLELYKQHRPYRDTRTR